MTFLDFLLRVACFVAVLAVTKPAVVVADRRFIRLLGTWSHNAADDTVEMFKWGTPMPHNSSTMRQFQHVQYPDDFVSQREFDESEKEYVVLMATLARAAYEASHPDVPLPPYIHDEGQHKDARSRYYCYVFEDTNHPQRLYIAFPGTNPSNIRDLWEDVKAFLPNLLPDMRQICPLTYEFSDADTWSIWENFEHNSDIDYYAGVRRLYEEVTKQFSERTDVHFTGHSLGGGMAAIASATFDKPAVAFSAPGTARLQHRKGISTLFNKSLRNFADANDLIAMVDMQMGKYCALGTQNECKFLDLNCLINVPLQAHGIARLQELLDKATDLPACRCEPDHPTLS